MSRVTPANIQSVVKTVDQISATLETISRQTLAMMRRTYALDAAARLAAAGRKPAIPLEFRSQFGEDAMIWDLLGSPIEGFFIEVGAFDGYSCSATYALEAMGWKGLLVEAIPERCEECRARRPGSRVVHAALSRPGAPATADFVVVADDYGGMLSHLKNAPSHLRVSDQAKVGRTVVSVPVTTMNELLKDHAGPIDVAVIDVEGAEMDLLAGFDLHRFKPRILLIEDNALGGDPALSRYMSLLPYLQAGWLDMNRVFIRADQLDVIKRASELVPPG